MYKFICDRPGALVPLARAATVKLLKYATAAKNHPPNTSLLGSIEHDPQTSSPDARNVPVLARRSPRGPANILLQRLRAILPSAQPHVSELRQFRCGAPRGLRTRPSGDLYHQPSGMDRGIDGALCGSDRRIGGTG